jgi:hypothetical protein
VAHNSMLEPRWQTVAERMLIWLQKVVAPEVPQGSCS